MTMAIINAFCFGISVPMSFRDNGWHVLNVVWPISAVLNGISTAIHLMGLQ